MLAKTLSCGEKYSMPGTLIGIAIAGYCSDRIALCTSATQRGRPGRGRWLNHGFG